MLYRLFWTLLAGVVIAVAVWAFTRWTQRNDFELGAQAERDGLPLNVGWSQSMKNGWSASWRARRGLNALRDEIGRLKP